MKVAYYYMKTFLESHKINGLICWSIFYSFFFSSWVMFMFVMFVEFLQASELLQELDSVTFDMNSKVQPQLENMTKNIYYSE